MTKKNRILHLIKSLGRGGAEKLIPETVTVHDSSRYEFFCLYFFRQENNLVDEMEATGIKVSCYPTGNFGLLFQVNKVVQFIQDNNIDIIHCHLPWAGVLGRLVAAKTGIFVVYTEHNIWERYNPISFYLNKFTFKKQDVAIAVSEGVKSSIQKHIKLHSDKKPVLMTICNGVNTEAFKRDAVAGQLVRDKYNIPNETKVIGTVAVFRTQKRLDLWIQIAKTIWHLQQEMHFLIVGDGEEKHRVLKNIGKGRFSRNVHLVGTQENVLPYLSAMDMYMGTSLFEGLPIAMLEAMACELPILSTRAGGIGEVVEDGEQGYLCNLHKTEILVDKAVKLAWEDDLRKKMGGAARQRVIEHFSMTKMVAQLEAVYEGLLEKSDKNLTYSSLSKK